MGYFDDLLAKQGEPWNPRKHNALIAETERHTVLPSPDVRQSAFPYGTFINFDGEPGGSGTSKFFRVSLTKRGELIEVRFAQGRIGGIEPMIGDRRISEKRDGRTPALEVRAEDFNDEGLCAIYLACELDTSFAIRRITPLAAPAKPAKEPWRALKLAGFLIRSGTNVRYDRELFSNLGFYPANRKANGFFDPLWMWAS